jgi:hypothetical protein
MLPLKEAVSWVLQLTRVFQLVRWVYLVLLGLWVALQCGVVAPRRR